MEQTWQVYKQIIVAYRHPNRNQAKHDLKAIIDSINTGIPDEPTELRTLGRTMKRRADDILPYLDHARSSNGPTEAIAGGFRTKIHAFLR